MAIKTELLASWGIMIGDNHAEWYDILQVVNTGLLIVIIGILLRIHSDFRR